MKKYELNSKSRDCNFLSLVSKHITRGTNPCDFLGTDRQLEKSSAELNFLSGVQTHPHTAGQGLDPEATRESQLQDGPPAADHRAQVTKCWGS